MYPVFINDGYDAPDRLGEFFMQTHPVDFQSAGNIDDRRTINMLLITIVICARVVKEVKCELGDHGVHQLVLSKCLASNDEAGASSGF